MTEHDKKQEFQKAILEYYSRHGRKSLPWRMTDDPWEILISEMLLRKTTAQQVAGVFPKFSGHPPEEVAQESRENLEAVLRPLGIQKERSRLLRSVASEIAEHGRVAMRDIEFLLSLPGVGQYSANAVHCFAFGARLPTLDRNMIRVLGRVFSYESERSRPHTDPNYWDFAEDLVPSDNSAEYNWGILDLAAEICRPRNPKCNECPLMDLCDYAEENK